MEYSGTGGWKVGSWVGRRGGAGGVSGEDPVNSTGVDMAEASVRSSTRGEIEFGVVGPGLGSASAVGNHNGN